MAVPFAVLEERPVLNSSAVGTPFVILSPPGEWTALAYERDVGERVVTFEQIPSPGGFAVQDLETLSGSGSTSRPVTTSPETAYQFMEDHMDRTPLVLAAALLLSSGTVLGFEPLPDPIRVTPRGEVLDTTAIAKMDIDEQVRHLGRTGLVNAELRTSGSLRLRLQNGIRPHIVGGEGVLLRPDSHLRPASTGFTLADAPAPVTFRLRLTEHTPGR